MKKARLSTPTSGGLLPEASCILCRSSVDDKERLGEMRTVDGVTLHYFCALFASGLYQNGDRETEGIWGFLLPDIKKESKRARRLVCAFCKKDGASVGCMVAACRVAFHFPCGLNNNVLNQYYDSFSSYCEKHRLKQENPQKKRRSHQSEDACAICLCEVKPKPTIDVLIAPCCQNSYLHRECVQRQALSSGLHFFKCPLCNNRELFTKEMLKFGIYIPDQDASWEREEDAFRELLERHSSCDVTTCLCKFGRSYDELDSCWELMLCDCCGSQGTHLFCSQLKTAMDDWMCESCTSVFAKASKEQDEKRGRKRKHTVATTSRSSSNQSNNSYSHDTPGSSNASTEHGRSTSSDHSPRPSRLPADGPSRSAFADLTSTMVSNPSPSRSTDKSYKPRPRCLSRYIQRHKTLRTPASENRPKWVKTLLNDDIHTGRNLGAKLTFMHTGDT